MYIYIRVECSGYWLPRDLSSVTMCRIIKMLIETAQNYQTKPLLLYKGRPISVLTNACLHHRLLISGQKGGKQNGAVVPIKGLS